MQTTDYKPYTYLFMPKEEESAYLERICRDQELEDQRQRDLDRDQDEADQRDRDRDRDR